MRKILCLGMALGITVAVFSCGYDSDPENKTRCQTNMAIICLKLQSWSNSRGGTPARIGVLYPYPLQNRTHFRCPSSSDDPTGFGEGEVLQPHHCSYLYNHLGCYTDLDVALQEKLILLYEKKNFHGPGRNVSFAGGEKSVRFLTEAEFQEALAFTQDWAKKNVK